MSLSSLIRRLRNVTNFNGPPLGWVNEEDAIPGGRGGGHHPGGEGFTGLMSNALLISGAVCESGSLV